MENSIIKNIYLVKLEKLSYQLFFKIQLSDDKIKLIRFSDKTEFVYSEEKIKKMIDKKIIKIGQESDFNFVNTLFFFWKKNKQDFQFFNEITGVKRSSEISEYIEEAGEKFPILKRHIFSYQTDKCPYCGIKHQHGFSDMSPSHRIAHCSNKTSDNNGYFLYHYFD